MKILVMTGSNFGHANIFAKMGAILADAGHDVTLTSNWKHPMLSIPEKISFKLSNVMFWFSSKLRDKQNNWFYRWTNYSDEELVSECRSQYIDFDSNVEPNTFDLLIVDRYLCHIAFMYPHLLSRILIVNTTTNPYRGQGRPPLNMHVSSHSDRHRLLVELYWVGNVYRRSIHSFKLGKLNPWRVIKKLSSILNQDINKSVFGSGDSCINYGIHNVPEFCAGFKSFDTQSILQVKDVNYLAINTLDTYVDVIQCKTLVEQMHRAKQAGHKVIYLNFGTVLQSKTYDISLVVQCFVNVLKIRTDIFGVIGGAHTWFDEVDLKGIDNVYVDNSIPQGYILKYSDLFITHGGLNSVNESILSATPMIGVLAKKSWDRPGNISKLVAHGVGLYIRLEDITSEHLEQKMNLILTNSTFLDNATSLMAEFRQEHDNCVENILEMCNSVK